MKLDTAIEIQTINNDHNPDYTDADREKAHQIGIEAMKRIQFHRHDLQSFAWPMLPGETND